MSAQVALQLAEQGFLVREMNVGWKEWTHNRHPVHKGSADANGLLCSCSKGRESSAA